MWTQFTDWMYWLCAEGSMFWLRARERTVLHKGLLGPTSVLSEHPIIITKPSHVSPPVSSGALRTQIPARKWCCKIPAAVLLYEWKWYGVYKAHRQPRAAAPTVRYVTFRRVLLADAECTTHRRVGWECNGSKMKTEKHLVYMASELKGHEIWHLEVKAFNEHNERLSHIILMFKLETAAADTGRSKTSMKVGQSGDLIFCIQTKHSNKTLYAVKMTRTKSGWEFKFCKRSSPPMFSCLLQPGYLFWWN